MAERRDASARSEHYENEIRAGLVLAAIRRNIVPDAHLWPWEHVSWENYPADASVIEVMCRRCEEKAHRASLGSIGTYPGESPATAAEMLDANSPMPSPGPIALRCYYDVFCQRIPERPPSREFAIHRVTAFIGQSPDCGTIYWLDDAHDLAVGSWP